jgi:hypothetical protein
VALAGGTDATDRIRVVVVGSRGGVVSGGGCRGGCGRSYIRRRGFDFVPVDSMRENTEENISEASKNTKISKIGNKPKIGNIK